MNETLCRLLADEHITDVGFLPIEQVKVINPRLLPENAQSVVMLVAPYDICVEYTDGVSAYAHVRDYHLFFAQLFERVTTVLRNMYPAFSFVGFADHSPIAEKEAAAKAGLGFLGCHSLFIHPVFGSYVFLGSIITDAKLGGNVYEIKHCDACGACADACPMHAVTENGIDTTRCLSALSQKKNLSDAELQTLRQHGVAWGCDRCQSACPHNLRREPTPIPFFTEQRHGNFNAKEIDAMEQDEFLQYAFSWRGKKRILQNLQNLADE